ncbi:MAG: hypothetical protein ABI430_02350 [Candidatus Taylorbacteria bacterium]
MSHTNVPQGFIMPKTEATGLIKITRVPCGEPPIDVRQEWVGMVLPCHPFVGYPDSGMDQGVLSGEKATLNRFGFSVPQDEAIAILERAAPGAARWWREHGYPKPGECFGFAENEAEIISDVTQKTIIMVDEERANPWR